MGAKKLSLNRINSESVESVRTGPDQAVQPPVTHGTYHGTYDQIDNMIRTVAARGRLAIAQELSANFAALDGERRNIEGAHSWLVTASKDPQLDTATQAAYGAMLGDYSIVLAPYLHNRGDDAQAVRWCIHALEACDFTGQRVGEVLLIKSEAEYFLGLWDQAFESVRQALKESENIEPRTYARATLALGRFQLNRGDYREALKTLEQAERLLTLGGDVKGVSRARAERASYYLNRRELDTALKLYLSIENRTVVSEDDLTAHSDDALLMIGVIFRKKRHYKAAERYLLHLIARGEDKGDEGIVAGASHHIAWLYLETDELTLARRYCGRAVLRYGQIEDLRGQSDAYEQLGLIALARGNRRLSIRYLRKSLVMRRRLGNQQGEASSLRRMASVYLGQGRVINAYRMFWQSTVIYYRIDALSLPQFANMLEDLWYWWAKSLGRIEKS